MGDTMIGVGKFADQRVFGRATSPEIIRLGPIAIDNFAFGIVFVGYVEPHSSSFPSRYDFYVWF